MNQNESVFFKEIFPEAWQLKSPLLFSIKDDAGPLAWECLHSERVENRLGRVWVCKGLEMHQTLIRFPGEQAIEVQYTLINTRSERVRLNELKLLDVEFSADQGPVLFRTLDGGANVKNYPPELFQVHDVLCDGVSEVWKEHGWGGRSSDETLPLMAFSMGDGALVSGVEWSGL